MRPLYSYALGALVLAALGLSQTAQAQQFTTCPASPAACVVEWDTNGDGLPEINALRNTVANDTGRPTTRVYVLRRGGLYYNEDRIVNDGFDLRLRGQTLAEARPQDNVCGNGTEDCGPATLQRFVREDGTSDGKMIESSNGGGHEFSNLWIMGQDNTGITSNYEPIVVNSANARLAYDAVIFDRNDWHHLGIKGGGNEIYFTNCHFRNLVGPTQRYEGRGLRLEAGADVVSFENNSFFNVQSFPIQSEAAPIEYLLFNHNTLVNFGLGFSAGSIWKEAYIANNVMINPFYQGESVDLYGQPNRADEFSGVFSIAALPARFGLEDNRRIALANNAYWRSPELEAYYATFDPIVRAQPLVNDSTQSFFDIYSGMVKQGNINQQPMLTNAPLTQEVYDDIFAFVESVSTNGATPYALVTWDPGRADNPLATNWPLPEDFSYSNTALQSAGSDGLPVGDLNWFPASKATYLANREQYVQGVEDIAGAPPEAPLATNIVQAEIGTPGANASVVAVDGSTSLYFESGGFATWTFEVPSQGTYGLNINTDLRGSDPRGQRFILDGVNLLNNTGRGELFFCTAAWNGGVCDQPIPTASGPTVYELRNSHLIDGSVDGLVLAPGTHTLRIEPSWGFQAFSDIEVVDASGAVVTTITPSDATTEGVTEECEDAAAYCPQGFKSVRLDAGGSVALGLAVPAGGMSVTTLISYTSASGGTGELTVDGESRGTLMFMPTSAGSAAIVVTDRVNVTGPSSTFTITSASGGVDIDFVQFVTYSNPASTGLEALPDGWSLGNAFPNPASGAASIQFNLGESGDIELAVFDVLGRKVATLVDGSMTAGPHQVRMSTSALSSGTYVYRLTTPVGVQTRRMTVVR